VGNDIVLASSGSMPERSQKLLVEFSNEHASHLNAPFKNPSVFECPYDHISYLNEQDCSI
jgi:hypothetical protein